MQIGVSEVAVVVKTERLALTVVVTLCQCRGMDVKEEQRVAIKFCSKVDFSATKTVELIQKACGDAALSRTTIFEWHKRFREGRESVKDDAVVGPQQVEPRHHHHRRQNGQRRSKSDISINSRYTQHPENCGSMDFKRRFEETKTALKVRQQ